MDHQDDADIYVFLGVLWSIYFNTCTKKAPLSFQPSGEHPSWQ